MAARIGQRESRAQEEKQAEGRAAASDDLVISSSIRAGERRDLPIILNILYV